MEDKKIYKTALILNVITIGLVLIAIITYIAVAASMAKSAYSSSGMYGYSNSVAAKGSVGLLFATLILPLICGLFSIAPFVFNIIACIRMSRANLSTPLILTIIGFIFGPLFSIIGTALAFKRS